MSVKSIQPTRWFEVQFKVAPDDNGRIALMLDGQEYTMDVALDIITAFRLGQALVRLVRQIGMPAGMHDTEV